VDYVRARSHLVVSRWLRPHVGLINIDDPDARDSAAIGREIGGCQPHKTEISSFASTIRDQAVRESVSLCVGYPPFKDAYLEAREMLAQRAISVDRADFPSCVVKNDPADARRYSAVTGKVGENLHPNAGLAGRGLAYVCELAEGAPSDLVVCPFEGAGRGHAIDRAWLERHTYGPRAAGGGALDQAGGAGPAGGAGVGGGGGPAAAVAAPTAPRSFSSVVEIPICEDTEAITAYCWFLKCCKDMGLPGSALQRTAAGLALIALEGVPETGVGKVFDPEFGTRMALTTRLSSVSLPNDEDAFSAVLLEGALASVASISSTLKSGHHATAYNLPHAYVKMLRAVGGDPLGMVNEATERSIGGPAVYLTGKSTDQRLMLAKIRSSTTSYFDSGDKTNRALTDRLDQTGPGTYRYLGALASISDVSVLFGAETVVAGQSIAEVMDALGEAAEKAREAVPYNHYMYGVRVGEEPKPNQRTDLGLAINNAYQLRLVGSSWSKSVSLQKASQSASSQAPLITAMMSAVFGGALRAAESIGEKALVGTAAKGLLRIGDG